jgi:hypothetical protein
MSLETFSQVLGLSDIELTIFLTLQYIDREHIFFAGVPGFEPGSGGSKGRCLTTWLHPNRWDISHSNKKRPTHIELAYKYIEKSKVSQSEIHFSCIDFRFTFLYFNDSLFWRKDADNAK